MEEEFVSEWLEFMDEFYWIYDYPNTHILVQGVLDQIPGDWIEAWAAKNDLEEMPTSYKIFRQKCDKFVKVLSHDIYEPSGNGLKLTGESLLGLSPKKQHEVLQLASFLQSFCVNLGVNHVVDFGCGLGYLDRILAKEYAVHVLGLEQDAKRVETALRNNESWFRSNELLSERLSFQALKIGKDASTSVQKVTRRWNSNNSPLGMVALHACGDLTVTMLKLFESLTEFKMAAIVSCCYHRMETGDDCKPINFPLSQTLRHVLTQCPEKGQHLRSFLFRLAAQETPMRTKTRGANGQSYKHMFYRAVLQKYAHDQGLVLKKKHRRVVHEAPNDFPTYSDQVLQGYGLTNDVEVHRSNLLANYERYKSQEPSFALLTILQDIFQPVAEVLVIFDRLRYCEESGLTTTAVKVFNDFISPRCWALVLTR